MKYSIQDHTFVLCAYGESPFLSECLDSLVSQSLTSKVLISTSTPNAYIEQVSSEFGVPVIANEGNPSISHDWNCAISHAKTSLITIAHQDDVYSPNYSTEMLEHINASDRPLIFFSDYGEIRKGSFEDDALILKVKRLLLRKIAEKGYVISTKEKRDILKFGSAICCPSVTYVMDNLTAPLFSDDMKCDLDWEAWERFSRLDGSFVYSPKILMHHRIHEGSETTALIKDDTRSREDMIMLRKFWPKSLAGVLGKLYSISMSSNSL